MKGLVFAARLCLAAVIAPVLLSPALWSQSVSTSLIKGTIQDSTGAAVPDAQIKVTQTATGASRTTSSGADGGYVLQELQPGPYQLEVVKDGFSTYLQTGIVLQVASNPTIDVALKIGSVSEQVQVEANAAMVETQSNGVGQVIDSQRVQELPLIGRNVSDLITISGGATVGSDTQLNTSRNYPTMVFSVAGGMGDGTAYMLDGATHNDMYNNLALPLPFPDALQEFKVETSSLPAQYGLHSSAVVNAVTKSGTNDFHGSVFEFVRNYKFNAQNFFVNANPTASKDSLKRNQIGGVLGGAIRKNKIFFFVGFQATTNRQSAIANNPEFVPTSKMLAGDFSDFFDKANGCTTLSTLLDPRDSRTPLAGFQIPSQLLDPTARKLAGRLPAASNACGRVPFGVPNRNNDIQSVGRGDYQINDKQSLFVRYLGVSYASPSPYSIDANLLNTGVVSAGTSYGNDLLNQALTVGHTYLFGPGVVSSFRASFNRSSVGRIGAQYFSGPDLGINMFSYFPKFLGANVTGGFSIGNGTSGDEHESTTEYHLSDDIGWVKGSHQFAFGISLSRWNISFQAGVAAMGTFAFNGAATGVGLADFVTGTASSFSQTPPNTLFMREYYLGMYAQDSWKITPRFTLNYGIRWEPYFPQQFTDGRIILVDLNAFAKGQHTNQFVNAPPGVFYPGDPGFPSKAGMRTKWGDIMPRVGIVWDPTGSGKTSIRASYGMFYDIFPAEFAQNIATGNPFDPPVVVNKVNFTSPWANYPGGNPFPLAPLTPNAPFLPNGSFISTDYNIGPTSVHTWNLSVQRQVAGNWLLSGTYLGTQMVHLMTQQNYNPSVFLGNTATCTVGTVVINSCNTNASTAQRRLSALMDPVKGLLIGNVARLDAGGTGNYHGMLLSVQKRLTNGITMTANYTWSHCISDLISNAIPGTGQEYTDPYNRRANRGNCNTSGSDRRQIFNFTSVISSPKFNDRMVRALATGWRLSTIFNAQTGGWLNIITSQDQALNGSPSQRVSLVGTTPYGDGSLGSYLPRANFALPALGSLGNLGAGSVGGPGSWNVNLGLSRLFNVREHQTLEFRAEANNLFNHFNPGNPNTTFGTANFGQITQTANYGLAGNGFITPGDPRIMQFALKYVF